MTTLLLLCKQQIHHKSLVLMLWLSQFQVHTQTMLQLHLNPHPMMLKYPS